MPLIQYIIFSLERAVEMLMDDGKSKTECALSLMELKEMLINPEKEVVDVDYMEAEIKEIKSRG